MTYFRSATATVLACSLLFLGGCDTPDAVSKFCGSSITTLSSANTVFDDMKQSCLREVNSRQEFGTFKPAVQSDENCTKIDAKVEGAKAAAKVLSDYFTAINSLASFGTAKAGTDAKDLATKTGAALGASSAAQTAVGAIAEFLVSAATSGFQQKQLEKDLPKVSSNVTAVVNGLVRVILNDYFELGLDTEEAKLATQYEEFAKKNSTKEKPLSAELKLSLHDRWLADEAVIAGKRASAQSLVAGLQAISKGLADLAANAHKLKAKDLPALLSPYITQIQALIPAIQKAF